MEKQKRSKGITLVALIVTIIILLILAGVSIATLTQNGLFEKAIEAKETYLNAQEDEKEKIDVALNKMLDEYLVGSSREENKLIYKIKETTDITTFDYSSENKAQIFKAEKEGYYKIECWGASGKQTKFSQYTTNGAYTKGIIKLSKGEEIFVFVGQQGTGVKNQVAFNGGGACTAPASDNNNAWGGGATDIRLINGEWDSFDSLKSRIMVAAGGTSQMQYTNVSLSYAGKLSSNKTTGSVGVEGATQTSGYKFGIGQSGARAGGGGGYYGGNAGSSATRWIFLYIRIPGM